MSLGGREREREERRMQTGVTRRLHGKGLWGEERLELGRIRVNPEGT